jgi:hypothetical protein
MMIFEDEPKKIKIWINDIIYGYFWYFRMINEYNIFYK